ncbi:hypothetical protein D6851_16570 [Altericroceibacterium spongiae]|uniref:Uncharacterized protein n=1 Tax=Altericroceibacterium spongiae TaxID=2320269 RepID=A0A420EA48_9SPHN|nr:hypothetical protein [Altericroceibacterium spongiae]RKF17563.1 hypothetical protein D6851_16570 [Altericroceibacterium spongiae]
MACTIAFAHPGGAGSGRAALYAHGCGLTEEIKIIFAFLGGSSIGFTTLFRLKDEGVALVAIDAAEALRTVTIVLEYSALKT